MKMCFAKRRHLAIGPFGALLLVSVILANATSSLRAQPASWIDYTSPDYKFSARFPGSVDVSHRAPSPKGISVSSFTTTYASCIFRIDDYNYPANLFPARNDFVDWFIDDSQASELKALTATLLPGTAHPVSRNKIQGREFIAESDKSTLTERIYITDAAPNTFDEFSLKVLCLKGQDNSTLATSFLNSFQIIDNVKASNSVDRDGLWEGDYQDTEVFHVDGLICRSGKVSMLVDGLDARISGSPSDNSHFSLMRPNFIGSLDSPKKGVTATIQTPYRRAAFRGEFSSDSTFIGSYTDGGCKYSVSLRREFQGRLEEVAPKAVPPEVRQYLPQLNELRRCTGLTTRDERIGCFEQYQKENPETRLEIQK
jgi:hypothetical protein